MRLFYYVLLILLISSIFPEAFATVERIEEGLVIPYSAFNSQGTGVEYFESEHIGDWLLTIKNNLIYNSDNPESTIVLRLKENERSDEHIELTMDAKNKISIVVSIEETSDLRLNNAENSWFSDKPLILFYSKAQDGKISISNGESTIVDGLKVGEFVPRVIEFYGVGHSQDLPVVLEGKIRLEIISGNPVANFPFMLILIFVGFAAALGLSLRKLKSTKEWYSKTSEQ